MAAGKQQIEMTRLGFYGLIPFVVSAVGVWLSPWLLPQYVGLDFHQIALAYGAIIVAYLAGGGAGASLSPAQKMRESFIPGQLITLAAFVAVIPNGTFFLSLDAVWRHVVILMLLVYLLMRDLNAVRVGFFPRWYGALRTRLTFWAALSIMLIISRLLLWGHY